MFSHSFSCVQRPQTIASSSRGRKKGTKISNSLPSQVKLWFLNYFEIVLIKYVISTETPYLDKIFIDNLIIKVKETVKFWDDDFNMTLRCRRSDFKY